MPTYTHCQAVNYLSLSPACLGPLGALSPCHTPRRTDRRLMGAQDFLPASMVRFAPTSASRREIHRTESRMPDRDSPGTQALNTHQDAAPCSCPYNGTVKL